MIVVTSGLGIGLLLHFDPATPGKICQGLVGWMEKLGVSKLTDLIGALELPGDQAKKTVAE